MILGKDIKPKKQIYYISALILNELKTFDNPEFDFFGVFNKRLCWVKFLLFLVS